MTITASRDRIYAPELDGALAWLNVARPITMRELRGQVVILDFWTYCCINCVHVAPTLRELERRYRGRPLSVIGVHSGKFAAEKDPKRIREAVGRYGIEHPVAVDHEMAIWSRYAIRSWPTLVVVQPDGRIAAIAPGEPDLETLDAFVAKLLAEAREAGTLRERAVELESHPPAEREPLCYPGKVASLPERRFAVADSGHHRVLVCGAQGDVLATFGGGRRGHRDGVGEDAAFDDPQGMCFHEGALYAADSRNHLLRRLDLDTRAVTTVAGTGRLGVHAPEGPADALSTSLRSPWDLCAVGDAIYVAMAGGHQIWRFLPAAGTLEVFAGTGVETLIDGDVRTSAWAQPSGLSAFGSTLYVADSETSAIRAVDLQRGTVTTLLGLGLFDFGDGDGDDDRDVAMLQHCLGVAADAAGIVIADTYNGKIKRWSPHPAHTSRKPRGRIRTLLDGLHEPASVAIDTDGTILIADTNAHRLLRWRDGTATEITITGAPKAQRGSLTIPPRGEAPKTGVDGWFTTRLELPPEAGLAAGEATLTVVLGAPAGLALAPGSPISVAAEVSRRSDLLMLRRPRLDLTTAGGTTQPITVGAHVLPIGAPSVEAEVVLTIDYVACDDDDHAACSPARLNVRLPVRLLKDSGSHQLEYAVALEGGPSAPEPEGTA